MKNTVKKLSLSSPVDDIPGVGVVKKEDLSRLRVETVRDLLHYFPYRYEDFSRIKKIGKVKTGELVSLVCVVVKKQKKRLRGRRVIVEVAVEDGTGIMTLSWFNQSYRYGYFSEGDKVLVSGKVTGGRFGLQMSHPSCEKIADDHISYGKIVPVYSSSGRLDSSFFRRSIERIVGLSREIGDYLPEEFLAKENLMPLSGAIYNVHAPSNIDALDKAIRRMSFDELLIIQTSLLLNRIALRNKKSPVIKFDLDLVKRFLDKLPFVLTDDQKKVAWQIFQDLEKDHPMNRLLEGDVGSGKTVVAALSFLVTNACGYQSVMMAPTEILARQHFNNFTKLFENFDNIRIVLILGRDSMMWNNIEGQRLLSRSEVSSLVESGEAGLVVGTQAVLSDSVNYKNIGLVCVDEQHRFGVTQRQKVKKKAEKDGSYSPHFLSMTATPIPRTLALSLYGDLDMSVIKSRPKNRKPVVSIFGDSRNRKKILDLVSEEISKGGQVFVVCPLVVEKKENTLDDRKAVMEEYQKIKKYFSKAKVGYLYGKMKKEQQVEIMSGFSSGDLDIMVASSIVEVGVDVPNASVMIIENADRFGLAQLHQLRGRVGRGDKQSYCVVMTQSGDKEAIDRLQQFVTINDGFELAELDLKLRGPGEFWGMEQSGFPKMFFAKLSDATMIEYAKKKAVEIVEEGIKYFPGLAEKVSEYQTIDHFE